MTGSLQEHIRLQQSPNLLEQEAGDKKTIPDRHRNRTLKQLSTWMTSSGNDLPYVRTTYLSELCRDLLNGGDLEMEKKAWSLGLKNHADGVHLNVPLSKA